MKIVKKYLANFPPNKNTSKFRTSTHSLKKDYTFVHQRNSHWNKNRNHAPFTFFLLRQWKPRGEKRTVIAANFSSKHSRLPQQLVTRNDFRRLSTPTEVPEKDFYYVQHFAEIGLHLLRSTREYLKSYAAAHRLEDVH